MLRFVPARELSPADNPTPEAIEAASRRLIEELNRLDQTYKSGSAEREERADQIYDELYRLAEHIRTRHSDNPRMREIYLIITETPLNRDYPVRKLPVYTDEFRAFTRSAPNPRVLMLLQHMAQEVGAQTPEALAVLSRDPNRDPQKELMEMFIHQCGRAKLLKRASAQCCHNCWHKTLSHMYYLAVELLQVELLRRTKQVQTLVKAHKLPETEAQHVINYFLTVADKVGKLTRQMEAHKRKTKQDWIKYVEAVYQIIVNLINELMTRLFRALNKPVTVRDCQFLD